MVRARATVAKEGGKVKKLPKRPGSTVLVEWGDRTVSSTIRRPNRVAAVPSTLFNNPKTFSSPPLKGEREPRSARVGHPVKSRYSKGSTSRTKHFR